MRKLLAALVLLMATAPASAAIVITALEVGHDVVVTAVGSVDTTGMVGTLNIVEYNLYFGPHITGISDAGRGFNFDFKKPQDRIITGHFDFYTVKASGPGTIGDSQSAKFPNLIAGSNFGFQFTSDSYAILVLPAGYQSGAILGSSMQFFGATFDSLGFTRGSYVWNIPADTLTFNVGPEIIPPPPITAAVPEATTWAMMLVGFGMMGAVMRRRRSARLCPA